MKDGDEEERIVKLVAKRTRLYIVPLALILIIMTGCTVIFVLMYSNIFKQGE